MNNKDSMLCDASITGNVNDFEEAIKLRADVNTKNAEGQTPLCMVAKCRLDLVKILIGNGADVNIQSDKGSAPLHWAVEYDNVDIVEYLLKNGANTELRDENYETPLHWAGWTGHYKSAKILLQYGANKNAQNGGGITPIDLAKRQGHSEVSKLLE